MVGGSKGVGGVWLAETRASAVSGLQRQWQKRQQGLQRHLVYSANGGCEGVGGVRGSSGDGNDSKGFGGVWGNSGSGNGRWGRQPVSGGADSGVRDGSGKGKSRRRKRAREVSGSEGGRVAGFGFFRGVSGIGDGSSDGNGRRRRQTVSGGVQNGNGSSTVDGGRRKRGQLEASRVVE